MCQAPCWVFFLHDLFESSQQPYKKPFMSLQIADEEAKALLARLNNLSKVCNRKYGGIIWISGFLSSDHLLLTPALHCLSPNWSDKWPRSQYGLAREGKYLMVRVFCWTGLAYLHKKGQVNSTAPRQDCKGWGHTVSSFLNPWKNSQDPQWGSRVSHVFLKSPH